MEEFTISILSIFFLTILYFWKSNKSNSKGPPIAPYPFPIIGHAWAFIFTDLKDFLLFCHKSCGGGGIFEIRVFFKRWIYICDRTYVRDYFKASEQQLSLFSMFDIDHAFGCPSFPYAKVIDVLRSGFAIAADGYLSQLGANCEKHCKMLSDGLELGDLALCPHNERALLESIVRRFIDTSTAEVMLEIEMDAEGLNVCKDFEDFFHTVVGAASFLPQGAVNFVTSSKMKKLRANVVKYIVEKYRENEGNLEQDLKGSRLLRKALKMVNGGTDNPLGDKELEGIVCTLMVGGSENSAVHVLNMLADIETHPQHLERLLAELRPLVLDKDHKGILKAPFLDACFNESARLSMGLFSFQRQPINGFSLGNFTLPKNSSVILAAPLLQVYGKGAETEFPNPEIYDPTRFLSDKEIHLLTFGYSRHYCPAKTFSVHLVKIALAYLITGFSFEMLDFGQPSFSLDYMAFSTFAERKFKCSIRERK